MRPAATRVLTKYRLAFANAFSRQHAAPRFQMLVYKDDAEISAPAFSRAKSRPCGRRSSSGANSGRGHRLAQMQARPCRCCFFSVDDPLAAGLVDSLVTPRLGMTGYTLGLSTERKRQELLMRLAPAFAASWGKLVSKRDPRLHEGLQNKRGGETRWAKRAGNALFPGAQHRRAARRPGRAVNAQTSRCLGTCRTRI